MYKKNDLCERLLKFAVDVILYLRIFKFQAQIQREKTILFRHLGLGTWSLRLGASFKNNM